MRTGQWLRAVLGASVLLCSGASAANGLDLVERGRYVAQLGDCVACHTAKGGPVMAGGRKLFTPIGVIYSTNITPDADTGIGRYSFEQFERSMRRGIAADGHNLYPAMPYPSYAKTSDEDMRALYAYVMKGVPAVRKANQPAEIDWPFSMRWGLSLWNWAFLDAKPFAPVAAKDAVWNRGAYLVQGLGHCGACHTPRGIAFQEKATSEQGGAGKHFLAGETVEGWRALSLRGLWTVADTAQLLKTGQNRFAAASGTMAEIVHHSTQHYTDADVVAVATYLKSLPPGEHDKPMPSGATTASRTEDLLKTRGGQMYAQLCAGCHQLEGTGVIDVFPPLKQNPAVASPDAATLLHIALTGFSTAETVARPSVYTMPGFSQLSDQEIAEVLSFVRASWGNGAKPVTASEVTKTRAHLGAMAGR